MGRKRIVKSLHPTALPAAGASGYREVSVYHLSTPAHLGIFLENHLEETPGLTASIRSHMTTAALLEAEPVLGKMQEAGRIRFPEKGFVRDRERRLAVLLHSRHARAGAGAQAGIRLAFLLDAAREKYIIGGDGSVWHGGLGPTLARKALAPVRRCLFTLRRRLDRRAVEAGLARLEGELARPAGHPKSSDKPDRIVVARRPMLLWADSRTGSLHRDPGMTHAEEQAMYDSDYHGRVYIDERRDWDALLREYQDRRWRNTAAVVPAESLKRGGRALDIGCGTGGLCDVLRQRGFAVTGVERSPQMIDICLHNFPEGIDFRTESVEDLRRAGARFDLITLSHVLEHIGEPVPFLRDAAQLLTPDGVLYVELPLFINDPDIMGKRPDWIWQRDHYHEFTRAGLAAVTEDAGLRIVAHGDSLHSPGGEPYQFLAARRLPPPA